MSDGIVEIMTVKFEDGRPDEKMYRIGTRDWVPITHLEHTERVIPDRDRKYRDELQEFFRRSYANQYSVTCEQAHETALNATIEKMIQDGRYVQEADLPVAKGFLEAREILAEGRLITGDDIRRLREIFNVKRSS
jgi:hypothetical protein